MVHRFDAPGQRRYHPVMHAAEFLGVAVIGCSLACGCLDSAFLHGKDCDSQGECLTGYVCDQGTGKCVRPGEIPDAADGWDEYPDAGDPADGGEYDGGSDQIVDAGDYGDCPCPDCQGENFICVHGPADAQSTGPPGTVINVYLDRPGYDPGQLVCHTQNQRLMTPGILFSSDFEADFEGFTTVIQAERRPQAQSILAPGSFGAMLCLDGALLQTAPIDTTGRTNILLKYAAVADLLEDSDTFEFLLTEYSYDDGATWFVLDVQGDGLRDADWQWFNHILPPTCEDVTGLRLRFRIQGSDYPDDCAYLDDVSILALPEPTLSRKLFSNHFELVEGNVRTADCLGDEIAHFSDQIPDGKVCLEDRAQNPASLDDDNQLGVLIKGRGTLLKTSEIDTRFIPAGSRLVAGFYMAESDLPPEGYANAWYRYRNIWQRMGGIGASTAVDQAQVFRFIWDPASVGLARVEMSFWIPDAADGVNDSHSIMVDDIDIDWHRASHDLFGPFSDQGNGVYVAFLQSDLPGTAEVTCIFYGSDPPLLTDASGLNSGSYPVEFE